MNERSEDTDQPKARRRLVFVEDMHEQVKQLEQENRELTAISDELRSVLEELVKACEAGGTVRYMQALGRARRLLDKGDVTQQA